MSKPKMTESANKLIPALNDLQGAQNAWEEARELENRASSDTTAALNRLNNAQKAVDSLMAEVREAGGGDWESERRRSRCRPVSVAS